MKKCNTCKKEWTKEDVALWADPILTDEGVYFNCDCRSTQIMGFSRKKWLEGLKYEYSFKHGGYQMRGLGEMLDSLPPPPIDWTSFEELRALREIQRWLG